MLQSSGLITSKALMVHKKVQSLKNGHCRIIPLLTRLNLHASNKGGYLPIAVPQFFTRGSSFDLPLVLWVFYRMKIKLLKFFYQTNSLELFCVNVELSNLFFLNVERNSPINRRSSQSRFVSELRSCCGLETLLI